jgi:peptide/nickel transport system permease protein
MNGAVRYFFQFLVACLGIIVIGIIPVIFYAVVKLFKDIKDIVVTLFNLGDLKYQASIHTEREVFPAIIEPYLYSMTVLFAALVIGVISAIVLTYITMLLHRKVINAIKFVVFLFESLPDIFVIILVQSFIVWIYHQTGTLLFSIAVFKEKIYFLPIICLAVLPAVQFYKILILIFEEELEQPYVELARGKGMKKSWILLNHVLRNAAISMFFHSKTILWFMLSNLLILEYLFNLFGITTFLREYMTPSIFTIGVFMIFFPLFVLYTIGEKLILRLKEREAVNL